MNIDSPKPVPMQISVAVAAQGGQHWLRMLAQAGVTVLPGNEQKASGAASDGLSESLDELWEQVIVAPEPLASWPAGSFKPAVDAARIVGAGSEAAAPQAMPASEPPAPRSARTTLPVASPATSAITPLAPNSSPNLKSVTPQPAKPLLTSYPDLSDSDRVVQLRQLEEQVSVCVKCPDLVRYRTQPVFGVGNIRPRLVMMGEAPGADEDRMGVPFVGASGQLLDKIIGAMKLQRHDVYILNSVKCRPPQNRNPTDSECQNCRPYWEGQLELLQPEVIVCLGAVASKTLLQTTQPVGQLRGLVHEYRGAKVVVTYHPSYLLRTESAKRQTWDDMKVVMSLLGLSL